MTVTAPVRGQTQDDATRPEAKGLPAWRVIYRTVAYRPLLWFLNLAAMMVLTAFWQIPGVIMRAFFNLITGEAPVHVGLWALVAGLFACEVGRTLGILGLFRTNVPFFVHTMTWLRKNLLRHVLQRPGAAALPDSPGEAISRFRGDVFEISLFALWLNDIQGLVWFGVVAVYMMLRINTQIALLSLVPFFFVGLIANAATKKIEYYRRASRKATGIVTGFIGEFFGAVQAVKVATAEEGVIRHFESLNANRRRVALKDRLFNEVLQSIFRNAVNIGTGVILVLASEAMRTDAFTVGDFALFVYFLQGISEMTTFAGLLVARYKQIGVSVERMSRLMEGAPANALVAHTPIYVEQTAPPIPQPELRPEQRLEALDVKGLTYCYPGSANGIKDITLSLHRGSFTVITGRVGSGKTTLLRALLGLLPRDGGKVYWNSQSVEDTGAFFVPPIAAYTAQVPRLFSDTLGDNLLMGLERDEADVMRAIRQAVLEDDLASFEQGLQTMVGPKGVKLSGGQIQRTAAARMFVRRPELLVFDDLSSALDVETERTLWERVFEQHDATCLVVSNRKVALRRADHIIVLKDGCIEDQGNLEELLERCPEMQRLWHADMGAARRASFLSEAALPVAEDARKAG